MRLADQASTCRTSVAGQTFNGDPWSDLGHALHQLSRHPCQESRRLPYHLPRRDPASGISVPATAMLSRSRQCRELLASDALSLLRERLFSGNFASSSDAACAAVARVATRQYSQAAAPRGLFTWQAKTLPGRLHFNPLKHEVRVVTRPVCFFVACRWAMRLVTRPDASGCSHACASLSSTSMSGMQT